MKMYYGTEENTWETKRKFLIIGRRDSHFIHIINSSNDLMLDTIQIIYDKSSNLLNTLHKSKDISQFVMLPEYKKLIKLPWGYKK